MYNGYITDFALEQKEPKQITAWLLIQALEFKNCPKWEQSRNKQTVNRKKVPEI